MVQLIIADLVVLAKHALQVTVGEEYIADTFWAADHRLFSHMITDG
jgi:hypothetical protein